MHLPILPTILLPLLLLLTSLTTATPTPINRPRPRPTPGCPSHRDLIRSNQFFIRLLERTDIASFPGGYDTFTATDLWDNFTITDGTENYPAKDKAKKRPVPGRWAKSRKQFTDGLEENLPGFRDVFAGVEQDPGKVNYGGRKEGGDCLTGFWVGNYRARLRRGYGGKPAGTRVEWKYSHTLRLREWPEDSDTSGRVGFPIERVQMETDWSAFFKA